MNYNEENKFYGNKKLKQILPIIKKQKQLFKKVWLKTHANSTKKPEQITRELKEIFG